MARIFISYAREDYEEVNKLYRKLVDAGFTPWMDKVDLLPGVPWQSAVEQAIQEADFFIMCMSTKSVVKRGFVQREIKIALDLWQEKLETDIYLIPVRLESALAYKEIPERVRRFQCLDWFEPDEWPRLLLALQTQVQKRTISVSASLMLDKPAMVINTFATQKTPTPEHNQYLQREFTKLFMMLQGHEDSYCPSVFILRDSTREGDLIGLFGAIRSPGMLERIGETIWKRRVEIQLYCQMPGCWHPTGCERGRTDPATGLYQIEEASEFLQAAAPYVAKLAKVMKYVLPLTGPFASAFDAEKYEKQFKNDIDSVKKFVEKFDPKMLEGLERQTGRHHDSLDPQQADGAALRALRRMLDKDGVDPYRTWGGLKKVTTKEGHILWLCPDHVVEYRP